MSGSTSNTSNSSFLVPNPAVANLKALSQPLGQLCVGSATGNPRNKCALKPGHSLMDWVRLGNSGEDLAGTGGRVLAITSEELAKHNTREDAWLAVRGKVYNVTRYMDFHPGGIDELMRGIGHDATKLFDEVHAWVNYQQLLSKCFVGTLQNIVKLDRNVFNVLKTKPGSTNLKLPDAEPPSAAEIIPRIDWIQRRSDLTFYIFTRQYCNPGLILNWKSAKEIQLSVQIEHIWHKIDIELEQSVEWPPKLCRIATESGKIELNLLKINSDQLWTTYGAHKLSQVLQSDEDEQYYDYAINANNEFNQDSFELSLRPPQESHMLMIPPLGFHTILTTPIDGQIVERSYTPVYAQFLDSRESVADSPTCNTNLNFLIKSYTTGLLSATLRRRKNGALLQVSAPRGNFKLSKLQHHRRFVFLAAGSGLTPFLNLTEHLLKRVTNKIDYLQLIYFNKTEADIWCRKSLELIESTDERFKPTYILSQPSDDWRGLSGRISNELLSNILAKSKPNHTIFVAVCGPTGFNQAAETILQEQRFPKEQFHIFLG